MKTPIVDFVREYDKRENVRLHMPGHKGVEFLGCERFDITEIDGADVLYSPSGIILESENNASKLFGTAHSFYSTEGSSLCIKAMLAMATAGKGDRPLVLAARNAHKAFIYACALLDINVEWLYPTHFSHLCVSDIIPSVLEDTLSRLKKKPCAVYVTSPDYLGNMLDIRGLSEVCRRHGVLLIVDNAHGAYLNFLDISQHPISLGADMCCDSAHKTLPVLTGGAYLHISERAAQYCEMAREKLSLFASTSPSYLILQSLDMCNSYIKNGYRERLNATCNSIYDLKARLASRGYSVYGSEPLKFAVDASKAAFSGKSLAYHLKACSIEIEFCDEDFAVMMFTPENSDEDIKLVEDGLMSFNAPYFETTSGNIRELAEPPKRKMSIREAVFSLSETVPVEQSVGRTCAAPSVNCPPAVAVVVSGEVIEREHIELFRHYGIQSISVVKEPLS